MEALTEQHLIFEVLVIKSASNFKSQENEKNRSFPLRPTTFKICEAKRWLLLIKSK